MLLGDAWDSLFRIIYNKSKASLRKLGIRTAAFRPFGAMRAYYHRRNRSNSSVEVVRTNGDLIAVISVLSVLMFKWQKA